MRSVWCVVLCFLSLSGWALTPADMLNQRLLLLQTLKANYIQTSDDITSRDKKVIQGDVVMERPNQFRWRIVKPYQQELLSDGKKIYIYDKDLDQVVIRPITTSVQDAPALLLIGETSDVSKDFIVRHHTQGSYQDMFILTPKNAESMIKSIELTYQGSAILSMRFQDTLDQEVNIQFTDLEQNADVPPDAFQFKVPDGVDIIKE